MNKKQSGLKRLFQQYRAIHGFNSISFQGKKSINPSFSVFRHRETWWLFIEPCDTWRAYHVKNKICGEGFETRFRIYPFGVICVVEEKHFRRLLDELIFRTTGTVSR